MFNLFKRPVITLDEQISNLTACGITLRSDISKDDLLISFDVSKYQKTPYELLLCCMGGEVEKEPFDRIISDNIWHFDAECIEDHGAYKSITERMRLIAGNDLPLMNVEDYIDVESGVAWLSFELDGKKIRWEAKVDNDWADPAIFSKFVELLRSRNVQKFFTYCDLGQDCLIGCWDKEKTEKINRLLSKTSLKFIPLK
jgi:hypothetical protein